MAEPTPADVIWNRACMEDGGEAPRVGDRALAALLLAHGLAMNGGVLHAAEMLSDEELAAAVAGYRFFGLEAIAALLCEARGLLGQEAELDEQESMLDQRYAAVIPDDELLVQQFREHWAAHPEDYAPA